MKQPPIQKIDNKEYLSGLVDGYNEMYADPKAYAETKYAAQIKSLGRVSPRDARYKTVIPQDKNKIPN